MWNSGATPSSTRQASSDIQSPVGPQVDTTLRCELMAPFAGPVVPGRIGEDRDVVAPEGASGAPRTRRARRGSPTRSRARRIGTGWSRCACPPARSPDVQLARRDDRLYRTPGWRHVLGRPPRGTTPSQTSTPARESARSSATSLGLVSIGLIADGDSPQFPRRDEGKHVLRDVLQVDAPHGRRARTPNDGQCGGEGVARHGRRPRRSASSRSSAPAVRRRHGPPSPRTCRAPTRRGRRCPPAGPACTGAARAARCNPRQPIRSRPGRSIDRAGLAGTTVAGDAHDLAALVGGGEGRPTRSRPVRDDAVMSVLWSVLIGVATARRGCRRCCWFAVMRPREASSPTATVPRVGSGCWPRASRSCSGSIVFLAFTSYDDLAPAVPRRRPLRCQPAVRDGAVPAGRRPWPSCRDELVCYARSVVYEASGRRLEAGTQGRCPQPGAVAVVSDLEDHRPPG